MQNGTYRTSDLYVAAWLLTNGFELQDVDHTNPRRCNFLFVDRQDRPELVHSFKCGRAVANVADFIFHLRRAKRLLYSVEPDPEQAMPRMTGK
jgi:hypothetical protein